ncbi:alkaline phosphatase family protein [Natronobiforma cellulositropha]|nr:alkaline phosphatase family protein [Natronobiforma cellulositropha]
MSDAKTVVFGFDALDGRYLERFADSLPTLTALRQEGVDAPLESTHPPWTGSAWPSMYTGCDPSHHGVYGFFDYDGYPDDGRVVSRTDVDRPAIWNYLSSVGVPSLVTNVPVTHPAEPLEGVLVPGYLAVEDEPGHPPGVREEIGDAIGETYRIYSRHELSDDPDEKFAGYLELLDLRRRVALALLEREEWSFALFQVQKTDAVFHNFDDEARFRAVYEAADRMVGDVLDTLEEDVNVIVCSDHGIGPVTGYSIYVNEVLRRHGYVEAATDGDGRPTLSSQKRSLTGASASGASASPLERVLLAAASAASDAGIRPASVYDAAERLGLESALLRFAPDALVSAAGERVDWRRSRAYCTEGTRMGIRINLAGREPAGVVPPDAYEDVRADLIDLLDGLETPDGEAAFELVCRREDVYDGPHLERAPDVLVRPTAMNHNVKTDLYGREFVPIEVYDHKVCGRFVAAGPDVNASASLERLSLTDVAPTAMALLGQPVPTAMTGRVPEGLLERPVERAAYEGVSVGEGAGESSAVDDDAVTDRLEDLGYL